MSTIEEIKALEQELRQAELGPNPEFFEKHLADEAIMVSDGKAAKMKSLVVEAHRPGKGAKFTAVDMSNMEIVDHGDAAVVTCHGAFSAGEVVHKLKFMRVWLKKNGAWQIVAGSISPNED
jgi:hypothetical protein